MHTWSNPIYFVCVIIPNFIHKNKFTLVFVFFLAVDDDSVGVLPLPEPLYRPAEALFLAAFSTPFVSPDLRLLRSSSGTAFSSFSPRYWIGPCASLFSNSLNRNDSRLPSTVDDQKDVFRVFTAVRPSLCSRWPVFITPDLFLQAVQHGKAFI